MRVLETLSWKPCHRDPVTFLCTRPRHVLVGVLGERRVEHSSASTFHVAQAAECIVGSISQKQILFATAAVTAVATHERQYDAAARTAVGAVKSGDERSLRRPAAVVVASVVGSMLGVVVLQCAPHARTVEAPVCSG